MITGVLMFDTPMAIDRLRKVIKQRFLSYPRFGQKAVDGPTGAVWQDDADFELDWHVRLTALPGRAGKQELERFVSSLASTPLDKTKPLWQFHLVESYLGGSALSRGSTIAMRTASRSCRCCCR
jgi:diacylglycerol O-acyltransferase / wax synthase